MIGRTATLTLIGGPTLLIEIDGFRLLTDPTFDPPGLYQREPVHFEKLSGPAITADEIGRIDAVLLSHDQHLDNLDHAGRALLPNVAVTYTTAIAAGRLEGNTIGVAPFQTHVLERSDGQRLFITAAPARHGPVGIERISGDVVGFLVGLQEPGDILYLTGDTVWYEGTIEVARRYSPKIVVPFAGSAEPRGCFHMTMNSNDVLDVAAAFPEARIIPIHNEGWVHFKESASDLSNSFNTLGVSARLITLGRGISLNVEI